LELEEEVVDLAVVALLLLLLLLAKDEPYLLAAKPLPLFKLEDLGNSNFVLVTSNRAREVVGPL